MSKFIQIVHVEADSWVSYALDDDGTIWKGGIDGDGLPFFIEYYRSVSTDKPKPKKEKTKKAEQPFHEWFNEIKQNDAYRGIDCNKELGKMKAWMLLPKNKNRKLTKRFVLNWLNKVEPEIEAEAQVCQRRVRKEGYSFMKLCGNLATERYQTSPLAGIRCCKDCYDELMSGRR